MVAKIDRTLRALADPGRRAVIELLRAQPMRASDIAAALGASRPGVSRQLRILKDGGLIEQATLPEDGRARVFRLARGPFTELRAWIDDVESMWKDQLASFQSHVARRARKP